MKLVAGEIHIQETSVGVTFNKVQHQTWQSLGSYNSLTEGLSSILEHNSLLTPNDRGALEKLLVEIQKADGDLRAVVANYPGSSLD